MHIAVLLHWIDSDFGGIAKPTGRAERGQRNLWLHHIPKIAAGLDVDAGVWSRVCISSSSSPLSDASAGGNSSPGRGAPLVALRAIPRHAGPLPLTPARPANRLDSAIDIKGVVMETCRACFTRDSNTRTIDVDDAARATQSRIQRGRLNASPLS